MTGVMLWAIICALIWWEAEKHAGFPRNVALKWALVCFFLGPLGVLLYVVVGRIMGPSAEEYRRQQALAPATSAAPRSPYQPPRQQRRRTSAGTYLLWIAGGMVGIWFVLYLLQFLL